MRRWWWVVVAAAACQWNSRPSCALPVSFPNTSPTLWPLGHEFRAYHQVVLLSCIAADTWGRGVDRGAAGPRLPSVAHAARAVSMRSKQLK